MKSTEPSKSDEPTDRMTRMVGAAIRAFEQHPEHRDSDQAIFLTNGGGRGGMVVHGYEEENQEAEVAGDLLIHLRAFCEVNGLPLQIHEMPAPGNPGDQ